MDYKFSIIRKPEDVLHFGKKGMKKGVRRYQNEDGTWTDEGLRERYEREKKEGSSRFNNDNFEKAKNKKSKVIDVDDYEEVFDDEKKDKKFKTAAEQKEKKDKKFKTAAEKKNMDKSRQGDDDDDDNDNQSNKNDKDDLKNRLKKMENLSRSSENVARVADRLVQKSIQKDIAEFKSKLDLSNMTDNDLRTSINRIRLEEDYKNLVSSDVSAGKRRMRDLLNTAGDITVAAGSIVALALAIKELRRKD